MTVTVTKLPVSDRPLIADPDLVLALEAELEPLSGKPLERAQAAIRKVHSSALQGPFGMVLDAYRAAIADAISAK
jgi:hypothetical protein